MPVDADFEGLPVNPDQFRHKITTLLSPEQLKHYEALGPDLKRQVNIGIFAATKLKERGDEVKANDDREFMGNGDSGIQNTHTQALSLEDKGGLWECAIANRLVDLTHTQDPKKRNAETGDIPQIAENYRRGFSAAQGGYDNAVYVYRGENRPQLQSYLTSRHSTVVDMQRHPKDIQEACKEIGKFVTTKLEESAKIHEEREILEERVIDFSGGKDDALVLTRGIILKEISLARIGIVLGRETDDNQLATRIDTLQQIFADDSRIPEWVDLQVKSYKESFQRQKQTAAKADNDTTILDEAERLKKLSQGFTKVSKALKR